MADDVEPTLEQRVASLEHRLAEALRIFERRWEAERKFNLRNLEIAQAEIRWHEIEKQKTARRKKMRGKKK